MDHSPRGVGAGWLKPYCFNIDNHTSVEAPCSRAASAVQKPLYPYGFGIRVSRPSRGETLFHSRTVPKHSHPHPFFEVGDEGHDPGLESFGQAYVHLRGVDCHDGPSQGGQQIIKILLQDTKTILGTS